MWFDLITTQILNNKYNIKKKRIFKGIITISSNKPFFLMTKFNIREVTIV